MSEKIYDVQHGEAVLRNPTPRELAAPNGYATAVWVLTCAAEDREKAASKLREWTEEERSPGLAAAIPQLEREAKELRAAAHALESHTAELSDGGRKP